ncbi:tRNA pseudouridine(55) synthase TruB [Microbulbifer thermotolerans]|uniref:tRNA pseudouridine synthase B n=1 Tax=Microbulbifer thermotolerans TaxID=252514 RepID=A0A143HK42_MICTH|nr:tRNA pseudouridine(55) synthase TruB [Microbulbifer thermotolerans]AMX01871.1 tRNA pseudouridine(55) synthase [Microbulbifer thermotolerans]MCX2779236.1 tRNA pseudouridine(55) synthase TruB [Microbulbifer thermotolerans]MCX2781662.1 tRNA pseudouridine(55) synthase TruB [Microbulbifer thermotolerans]MCX2793534.1 tRNA pseudouridine(55) synthase TruB [Microbulbifer thermotolerans]MCX2801596.1 tRNA pseudouridine(55) synthase TruB [Microbulbifer thermotolerans]
MGRRPKWGRQVHGVLLLNKPAGITANEALQKAKRLFFANRAGHTGALDPLATGVLPVCFGEATKFSQYLLDADKRYRSTFCFGMSTASGDADGDVIETRDASGLTEKAVRKAMASFRGCIKQVPSMYSALKHKGQPLYKLARQGVEVKREARDVEIYEYELLSFTPGAQPRAEVEIHCSKGTYVRSLAEDLGRALGVGAYVDQLHRSAAGPFSDADAVTLEALTEERGEGRAEQLDHHLLPVDAPAAALPKLILPDDSGYYLRQGQPVMDLQVYRIGEEGDMVRLFLESGEFLGVGEITDDGRVAPRRLVSNL